MCIHLATHVEAVPIKSWLFSLRLIHFDSILSLGGTPESAKISASGIGMTDDNTDVTDLSVKIVGK